MDCMYIGPKYGGDGGVGCWGGDYIPAMDFFIASGAVMPIEVGHVVMS